MTAVLLPALLALAAAEGGFQPSAAPESRTQAVAAPAEALDDTPLTAEGDSSAGHVWFSDPPTQAESRDSGAGIGGHGGAGFAQGHHAGGGGYGPPADSYGPPSDSYGAPSGGYDQGGYGGGYDQGGYGGGYDQGGYGGGYVEQSGYAGGYGDYAHGGGYGSGYAHGGYKEVVVEEKPWYEKYINRYKFPIFIPRFNFVTVDPNILERLPAPKGQGGKGKGGGFGSGIRNYFKGFFGGGKGKGKGGGKDETIIVNHHHYYDEGYGHGQKGGYAAPAPVSSYGAPPQTGYGAPDPGYGAPDTGYGAPAPSYQH